MSSQFQADAQHPRRNVRLDTLVRLRWLAVIGQTSAILVVHYGFDFTLPLVPCLAVIAASASLNVGLRLGFSRRAARLFPVLLDQTANRIRRLGAFGNPMIDPIELQRAVVPGLLRIVGPDDLDEFSVARAAAIGHHHFVVRAIERAFSA